MWYACGMGMEKSFNNNAIKNFACDFVLDWMMFEYTKRS